MCWHTLFCVQRSDQPLPIQSRPKNVWVQKKIFWYQKWTLKRRNILIVVHNSTQWIRDCISLNAMMFPRQMTGIYYKYWAQGLRIIHACLCTQIRDTGCGLPTVSKLLVSQPVGQQCTAGCVGNFKDKGLWACSNKCAQKNLRLTGPVVCENETHTRNLTHCDFTHLFVD